MPRPGAHSGIYERQYLPMRRLQGHRGSDRGCCSQDEEGLMRRFSYASPTTAEDAIAAYGSARTRATLPAGRRYDLMKLNIERPASDRCDQHRRARPDRDRGNTLRFGANARMADVAANRTVAEDYPVLAEALSKAASSIAQHGDGGRKPAPAHPLPLFSQRRGRSKAAARHLSLQQARPGSGCAAIGGLDRGQAVLGTSASCTAVSPGDWPVALHAMDASVELLGPAGRRTIPIAELYRCPARRRISNSPWPRAR